MPRLYPAKGLTLLDDDGEVITGAGVDATGSALQAEQLRQGKLLTRDPYRLSESPIGAWFEARKTTSASGKCTALVDLLDSTHLLSQGTSSAQCDEAADDDTLAGSKSLTFTGSQYYVSNRPASAWKHLHDGTGFDAVFVFVPTTLNTGTYTFISTCQQSAFATQVGYWWGLTVVSGLRQTLRVGAANATRVIDSADKTFGGQPEDPRICRVRYKEGASPEYVNGVGTITLQSGSSSIAPSSSSPQYTLCLGADNNGATFLGKYRFHSMFISEAGSTFSDTDIARIYTYIEDQAGIARPRSACATGKRRALVLAIGESMIVGQGSVTSGMPVSYPPVGGRVKRYDDSGRWLDMSEPNDAPGPATLYPHISEAAGQYGTGYPSMFCAQLQDLLDSEAEVYEVGLVPCGRSGSTSWDWKLTGTLFPEALEKARRAKELPNSEWCCILLDQGVNDCGNTSDPDGSTWTQRWNAAIETLRTELEIPDDVPLFYRQEAATIPTLYNTTKWTNLQAEQAAWETTTEPKRIMMTGVDSPSYYVAANNPHYNTAGNYQQSLSLYAKYLLHPGPQGNGPEPPVLTGYRALSGFDTNTVYGTEAGEGVGGSATTGLCVVVLLRLEAIPTVLERICERVTSNNGYTIRSNVNQLQFIPGNGVISAAAPSRLWLPGDVGKIHCVALSHDLVTVRSYFNSAELGSGSGTALAGYAPSSTQMVIGSTTGGQNPAASFSILAVAGRNSPLTLAEFEEICASTKLYKELNLGSVVMDHMWSVPLVASVPSSIEDTLGGQPMSIQQGITSNLTLTAFEADEIRWGW